MDFASYADKNKPRVRRGLMNTIKSLQEDSAKQFRWCLQNKQGKISPYSKKIITHITWWQRFAPHIKFSRK